MAAKQGCAAVPGGQKWWGRGGTGGKPEPWGSSSATEAVPLGEVAAAVALGAGAGCRREGMRVYARVHTSVRAGGRNN